MHSRCLRDCQHKLLPSTEEITSTVVINEDLVVNDSLTQISESSEIAISTLSHTKMEDDTGSVSSLGVATHSFIVEVSLLHNHPYDPGPIEPLQPIGMMWMGLLQTCLSCARPNVQTQSLLLEPPDGTYRIISYPPPPPERPDMYCTRFYPSPIYHPCHVLSHVGILEQFYACYGDIILFQLSSHVILNDLLLILDNTYSLHYLCNVVMKSRLVLFNLAVTHGFGSIFWIESLYGVLNLEPLTHFSCKRTCATSCHDMIPVATIDFTCYGVYSIVTNNITSLSHYLKPLSDFFEKPCEWKTIILLVHDLGSVYAMGLYPLHISKVVAIVIVSMWSVSSAPVWKKMIVVIVVKTSLGAEFLCCSNQHYCEFSCGELLHEYILATVIRACMHLGGLNQAFVNLIDFASLVFTTFALHQSLDSLLDFTHPTYSGIGKLDLTRNMAARELFGIYFYSIQLHVIAYVSIDAAVEKSLTMYVASSPRVNFVCNLMPSIKLPHGWVVTSGSRNDNYSAVDLVNIVFFGMLDHTNSSIFKYENQLNMSQVAGELAVSFDYQAPGYLTIDRELMPSIQIKVYCNVVYRLFLLVREHYMHT